MLIRKMTTSTECLSADCFVVDYDRLNSDGWPRLTLVVDYQPARTNRNAANCVDRIRALELLTRGLTTTQVAARLGCHMSTICKIRAVARDG